MATTGHVRIRRAPRRAGRFCDLTLLVNGEPVARLGNGEELLVPLTEGDHLIEAAIQGIRSVPVRVQVLADQEIMLETKAGRLHWALYVIPTGSIPMPRPLLRVVS